MTQRKKLSFDRVSIKMLNDIVETGQATTLDVKNHLRSVGYEATQKEVSEMMDAYYEFFSSTGQSLFIDEKIWVLTYRNVTTNGNTHRAYHFTEVTKESIPKFDITKYITEATKILASDLAGGVTVIDAAQRQPAAPATPTFTTVKQFVKDNVSKPSKQIVAELRNHGVVRSVASIAAIKANLNR